MSGTISNIGLSIPQPGVPAVGPDGTFSRVWYYVMIGLRERTGGAPGISIATLQKQVAALMVEEAMQDVQFPSISLALPVLTSQALSDDVPRAPLNPFLAAMLVSDASLT